MCIIIDNRAGEHVSDEILRRSVRYNPDGFGILDLRTFEVHHTMDAEEFIQLCKNLNQYIAHARYATVGEVSLENCHPFEFTYEKADGTFGTAVLFQNGTVPGYGDDEVSDTQALAEALAWMPPEKWQDFLGKWEARFLVVTESGVVTQTGEWTKYEEVLYSKTNVLPPRRDPRVKSIDSRGKHLVAVYGTLKQGFGNHRLLERGNARFLGQYKTQRKYELYVSGLPYLVKQQSRKAKNVAVELYEVDNATLRELDRLEGHPTFYERLRVQVTSSCSRKIKKVAWVYFHPMTKGFEHLPTHFAFMG